MKHNTSLQSTYSLLDSGGGRKLERFGPYVLSRPAAQAVWLPQLPDKEWNEADALFTREGDVKWTFRSTLPTEWKIEVGGVTLKISPTDFGHLGIFPEQRPFWEWIYQRLHNLPPRQTPPRVLNLFAYSGGSTLAAAKGGAEVCHLDASKGMVTWARENAVLNKAEKLPIRWIIDDASKFVARELKRGIRYDAIILDPPSFGRGSKGEVFKIEEDLLPLLKTCRELLSENPLFILFSCHTPGFTPIVMRHLLQDMLGKSLVNDGEIDEGEMTLTGDDLLVRPLPCGTFARWNCESKW